MARPANPTTQAAPSPSTTPTARAAIEAGAWARDHTAPLSPGPPVALVYHPLTYAWPAYEAYLARYAAKPKRVLIVGMNPGPWGMGQTGIPFGDVGLVGDWLGLRGAPIGAPPKVHPKRPVTGWACTRSEASGRRIWGLLKEDFGTADRALADLLIINHCPLLMFTETGTNVTPDKLRRDDRDTVFAVADEGVARMADAVGATTLIGVGAYAEERCQAIAASRDLRVLRIPHPSPASPLANREGGALWRAEVRDTLKEAGITSPSPRKA